MASVYISTNQSLIRPNLIAHSRRISDLRFASGIHVTVTVYYEDDLGIPHHVQIQFNDARSCGNALKGIRPSTVAGTCSWQLPANRLNNVDDALHHNLHLGRYRSTFNPNPRYFLMEAWFVARVNADQEFGAC
jgi:hypothetical protein